MAFGAIGSREMTSDHEAAMVDLLLSFNGAVTIQTRDPFGCVPARFELMHDSRGFAAMALRALSDSTGRGGGRLPLFDTRPIAIENESRHDQAGRDDNRDEYASERQEITPEVIAQICETEPKISDSGERLKAPQYKNTNGGEVCLQMLFEMQQKKRTTPSSAGRVGPFCSRFA